MCVVVGRRVIAARVTSGCSARRRHGRASCWPAARCRPRKLNILGTAPYPRRVARPVYGDLRAGVSIFDLSRFMGASLAMIDRHYGHLARDGREHAVALLDSLAAEETAWTPGGRRNGRPQTRSSRAFERPQLAPPV